MGNRKPTDATIEDRWRRDWQEAEEEFGDFASIPNDRRRMIEERNRALECVRTWETGSLARHLSALMIREDILIEMVALFGDGEKIVAETKQGAGGSKIEQVEGFLRANRGREISIAEVCDAIGVAHMTVRTALARNPEMISKIEKGRFLVMGEVA